MRTLEYRCNQDIESLLQGEQFRFIDNGASVLAVAHCDCVRAGCYHYVERGRKVLSTALDDRLGVHCILDLLPSMGVVVDVLLTRDEERCDSTAQHFTTDKRYNWMFQFDRSGCDAVAYQYVNAMRPFASQFWTVGAGSYTDICELGHLGCAGLNVGTAYYGQHTASSYADLRKLRKQLRKFNAFWLAHRDTHIAYDGDSRDADSWLSRRWSRSSSRFTRVAWPDEQPASARSLSADDYALADDYNVADTLSERELDDMAIDCGYGDFEDYATQCGGSRWAAPDSLLTLWVDQFDRR